MENEEEPLIEHLRALRQTLIKSIIALGVGLIPMFFAAPSVLDILIKVMLGAHQVSLNYFSPMEVFLLQIKTAVVLDLAVCFPYIARQVWNFILPGLYANERRFVKTVVCASSLLFAAGVLFCFYFILPLIINFGVSFATTGIQALFGISDIMGLAMGLSVIFGIMFQFPLLIYALIRTDIVSYQTICQKRPHIFVIILIIAGILTPPDVVSQIMLTIPTYLLFESGLFLFRRCLKGD